MTWYKTGTVSVTSGSATVTGAGTSWVTGSSIGEGFYGPDGKIYEISNITSATSLTITPVYSGTTNASGSYSIVPTHDYIRSLALQAATLISDYSTIATNAGSGQFGDGTISLPGVRFTADADTGIRRTASGTMALTTNGVDRVSITPTGASIVGTLSTSGNTTLGDASTDTVQVNGYMGVGGAGSAAMAVRVIPNALTGTSQYALVADPTASSAATTAAVGVWARVSTAATAYNVADMRAFHATVGVNGAGSTVTNAHGLYIDNQTQGTNNYGITSLVSSGANKWNIYASGTANNAFAGNTKLGAVTAPAASLDVAGNTILGDASTDTVTVNGYMGVGTAPVANYAVNIAPTSLTGTYQQGVRSLPVGTSAATSSVTGVVAGMRTQAASFTVINGIGVNVTDCIKGAGSTVTNQYGVLIDDQTQGTNNYGITSLVSSGANKWNIYASGTAANYFAGNVVIGSAASTASTRLTVATATTGVAFSRVGDLGENADSALYFGNLASGTGSVIASSGSGLIFRSGPVGTSAASQPEVMRITGAGNVGIGTAAPGAALDVRTSTGASIIAGRSSNVASNSEPGYFDIKAPNASGTEKFWGRIKAVVTDATNATEDADLVFMNIGAGALTERLRIDSAGRLLVGTTTSTNNALLQTNINAVTAGDATLGGIMLTGYNGTGAAASRSSVLGFQRSRSVTDGAFIAVASGDRLGNVFFRGDDGVAFADAAQIQCFVDGTVSTGIVPSRITLSTASSAGVQLERLRIDSAGNVGIGATGRADFFTTNTVRVLVEGTDFSSSAIGVVRNSASASGASLILGKTRSATVSGATIVASGDDFGLITFTGSDGASQRVGAQIAAVVDGTPGAGDMPGRLVFSTTTDGASSPTERMRIDSVGAVTPGANGTQPFGSTSLRWSQVWCTAGAFNTSDARLKTPVTLLNETEKQAAAQMSREIGTFQWLESIQIKGAEAARHHVGFTVQRAKEILESFGLDPWRYGFMSYDTWGAEYDADGNETKAAGDAYAFRYDQLNLFVAAGISYRLEALEAANA